MSTKHIFIGNRLWDAFFVEILDETQADLLKKINHREGSWLDHSSELCNISHNVCQYCPNCQREQTSVCVTGLVLYYLTSSTYLLLECISVTSGRRLPAVVAISIDRLAAPRPEIHFMIVVS